METGAERVIYGNVRNSGLIENLPEGCCVEVPCLVDRVGVQPTHVGALPAQLAALNRTFVNVCELTVRAALEGKPEHVYHAAMLDPNAAASLTLDEIESLVDELLAAHADVLPDGLRPTAAARR
jgi:alpha-galactosidase